jgi:arabinogalactan oligomer/maltooligosaccharide transport system substrate-binding protein
MHIKTERLVVSILMLIVSAAVAAARGGREISAPRAPARLALWIVDNESERAAAFARRLAAEASGKNPWLSVDVSAKSFEILQKDLLLAGSAGSPPALIWASGDQIPPLASAGLIQPVDGLFDASRFLSSAVEAGRFSGRRWGVPISVGGHLMLFYNKDLAPTPPRTTEELFALAKKLSPSGRYAIAWFQYEPFWLVPWLGAFRGRLFDADGLKPALDTPEMVATLSFLSTLKLGKILPADGDYASADALFKEGKAAAIVNGEWASNDYRAALGARLAATRIPKVSATGDWPRPLVTGVFFLIPREIEGEALTAARLFVSGATGKDAQLQLAGDLARVPALTAAVEDPAVMEDPLLGGSAEQAAAGVPLPPSYRTRCVWDAMKPELLAVMGGLESPSEAAHAMQKAAEACIAAGAGRSAPR